MKRKIWQCGCMAGLTMVMSAWAQNPPPPLGAGPRGAPPSPRLAPKPESVVEWLSESPHVADRLGLTQEQKEKLKTLLFEGRRELVELRAQVQVAALRQAELLSQSEPDVNAVMQAVERTGQLRTELAKAQVRQLLALRAMLTPEQRDNLRKLFRERWEARRRGEPVGRERRTLGRRGGGVQAPPSAP